MININNDKYKHDDANNNHNNRSTNDDVSTVTPDKNKYR